MSRIVPYKEEARSRILDAAQDAFAERGYDQTTMGDIAQRVGVSKGALYLYFKNKDELCFANAARGSKILNEMNKACCEGASNGFEKLQRLLSTLYKFYRDYPGYYLANWHSELEQYETEDPAMVEVKRVVSDNFHILEDAIAEGVRDGSVREDVNPALVMLFWISALQGVINLSPAVQMFLEAHGIEHSDLISYAIDSMLRSVERQ